MQPFKSGFSRFAKGIWHSSMLLYVSGVVSFYYKVVFHCMDMPQFVYIFFN